MFCALQEVHAGDFPSLPPNQPFVYDGLVGSCGREAGFLVRSGVTCLTLPGVEDVLSMRWRVVENAVCICSFHAPHAGLPEGDRVAFWQDLLQVARHVRATSDLPMILAGDANVWHPHFELGRHRAVDGLIVPLVDQLLSSCGLVLMNPSRLATHNDGGALDLMMMSSSYSGSFRIHDGMGCCIRAPGCCPLLGSDHFLLVASTTLRRQITTQVPRSLPLLRDWHPVLLRAHHDLTGWAHEVAQYLDGDIPNDESIRVRSVDLLHQEMVSILSWHAPRQHHSHQRRQPSWWSPDCLAACIARIGGWRDFRRKKVSRPSPVQVLVLSIPGLLQTLASPGRVHHASHVKWGLPSSTRVASSVFAADWRQDFVFRRRQLPLC